jgi:hypothetical protein
MNATLKDKIQHWSLERLRFLLSHIEGFIEDTETEKQIRAQLAQFEPQSGLEHIENLVASESPNAPELPLLVLERLVPFFLSGVLIARSPAAEEGNWWATSFFWRGQLFRLQMSDQVLASHVVPEVSPLTIRKAQAQKTLSALNLQFLCPDEDGDAYLLKPTPILAYVLITRLAPPWRDDHLFHTQRLITKCFNY